MSQARDDVPADLVGSTATVDLFGAARVLVVDDVVANVSLLERMLLGAGVGAVECVVDSRLVIDRCAAWGPDLILLDLHMPHMDGVAVLEALRATLPSRAVVPVLVLTADATDDARRRAVAADASDFVTKPFDRAEVLMRVRNLLQTRSLFVQLERLHASETLMALVRDRERIAQGLHDTVIQQLFAAGLTLQSTLALVDNNRATGQVRSTIEVLDDAIRELRMAVFSLQGPIASPDGLRGRILAVVADATAVLGFEPRIQFNGSIETTDADTASEMIHVLREGLSNVARHANAGQVRVSLDVAKDLVLTICDDGVGVPDSVFGGRGLANMADRAVRLGGACQIVNRPGGGASLTWQVPL